MSGFADGRKAARPDMRGRPFPGPAAGAPCSLLRAGRIAGPGQKG
jgi:hypothetical protein